MLDNMALQEGGENTIAPIASRPFHIQIARFISIAFFPAIIVLPLVLFVAFATHAANSLISAFITFFFLSVGPTLYIFIGVLFGKFTDIDVSVRSQRTGPFLFGLGSCLLGFIILNLMHAPHALQSVLLLTLVCGIIFMLITFWWKISIHASALASAITMLSMIYGRVVWPAFLLVALVSWSRVALKRHTMQQVAAGSLMGIVLTWLLLTITGI